MRSKQLEVKSSTATRLKISLAVTVLLIVTSAAAVSWAVETLDVPPRTLAQDRKSVV